MGACASAPRELKDEINAAPEPANEEMFDAVEGQEDVKGEQPAAAENKNEDDDNKTQSLGSLLDEPDKVKTEENKEKEVKEEEIPKSVEAEKETEKEKEKETEKEEVAVEEKKTTVSEESK